MARTVKPEEFAHKRNAILDAAQHLVYTKGYERMTIQDILAVVRISSGAFYHYFDSKPAVLEAFIQRMQEESENALLPIIRDPQLSAIDKLKGSFAALSGLRIAQKISVVGLLRVWYTDDNAIVRQKVDDAVRQQRAPLLGEIVRQGITEDVFTVRYPDQAGEVILALLQSMATTHAKLLLTFDQDRNEQACVEALVTSHIAYMDAIERVLGVPANALYRADAEAVKIWLAALQSGDGM